MHLNTKWLLVLMLVTFLTACGVLGQQSGSKTNASLHQLDSARAHTNLGAAYLQQNKLEIALNEFSKAIEVMPSYAAAYNGIAMVRSALQQDELAEFNFKKAIQIDPLASEAYNNYGTFLCSRGRYSESVPLFLEAVKNPLYGTPNLAYANAGICAKRDNDIDNAERYLSKALQIQPLTHAAAYNLADIQFSRGDASAAKRTLQNAILVAPSAEMLWLGIRIARKLGDKNSEASYSLELRRKFPDSNETKLLLREQ